MATQRTYIARKNQDVEFASGSFSGELELNGGAALADSDALTLGTSDDVSVQWDGTNLVIAAAADDSIIEFGDAAAIEFIGFTAASGNMIGANTAGPNTLNFTNWTTLRIRVAGTNYYLPIAQTIAAV